jgi:hypothetical protein
MTMPVPSEAYEALATRLVRVVAERDRARATAAALEQALAALIRVHDRYFDVDGEPGVDDTEPEPEDVWRFDRDFRAAMNPEATP